MTTPIPGPTPVSLNRQATMRDVLAVVFRRRWLILGLFASVTLTVLLLALLTPVTYLSTGRVLLIRGERQSTLSPQRQLMNEWEPEMASEVETARSTGVMQRARQLLTERARASGREPLPLDVTAVDVEVMGRSNVLAVGYTDRDRKTAHEVCDAVLTAYLAYRQNGQRMPGQDAFFAHQLDSLGGVMERLLRNRDRIAHETGLSNPAAQAQDLAYQYNALDQRRNEAQAQLAEAKSALAAMYELQKHPGIDLPTLDVLYTNDNALLTLKAKLSEQQTAVARLRERYNDDSPEVQNAMQTLETLQALLRREVDARLASSKARIDGIQARLAVHERDLAEIRQKLGSVPVTQHSIEDIDDQVRQLRQRMEEYSKARDQIQITAHTSQATGVVLLSPADAGIAKNARDYVRLALAPAFSIVVGFGLAFFFDGLDLTVRTASQAEEYLELPVLASIPERRNRRG
jgi:uncharacterized protein involved in exopolysaccharide biosynthesis